MQCERAQEFLSDYLEQTLDRPMTVALESHLSACPACWDDVEALRVTYRLLDAVPEVDPPRDGAWRVIEALRSAAPERTAPQPVTTVPRHLYWLRSQNPLRMAMGTGLATLVIVGGVMLSSPAYEWLGFGLPVKQRVAVQPAPTLPSVRVTYLKPTATSQPLTLSVISATDLPGAQVQIASGTMKWTGSGHLSAKNPQAVPVEVPLGEPVTILTVTVTAQGNSYQHLVAVPATRRATMGRADVVVNQAPLDETLRRLGGALDKPVVVDVPPQMPAVTLGVEGAPGRRVLDELADRLHATVVEEDGVYHLRQVP